MNVLRSIKSGGTFCLFFFRHMFFEYIQSESDREFFCTVFGHFDLWFVWLMLISLPQETMQIKTENPKRGNN